MTNATITVHLNRLNITPRKTRLVARLLRGQTAEAAEHQLLIAEKRAAQPLLKLLHSALASAKQRQLQTNQLIIKNVIVGDGPKRRKFHAGSRGRAMPLTRRTSHITLTMIQLERKKSSVETTPPAA